jgi:hypothetical protein
MTEPTTVTMDALPAGTVFSVDVEKRIIRGRAVPYGVVGVKAGRRWQFSKGTVRPKDGMKVKGWALHDQTRAHSVVTDWDDNDEGLDVAFAVAKTPEGDRALAQADSGVWDGLSIGPSEGAKFELRDGVYHSVDVPIHEISLTPAPVFGGARVSSVTFDAITTEGSTMSETETVEEQATAPDFSAITDAIKEGFAALGVDPANPQGGPVVIPAGATIEVNEESPYRFDGVPGEHDFSGDLIAFGRDRDGEAGERLHAFMAEAFSPVAFDVSSGNVVAVNPARQRPDMYVDERRFKTPLYDAIHSGAITDNTPFIVPKFKSALDLVDDHVEGVEPTNGTFEVEGQTITPSPVSGKVPITREVWDQGGNPQVSGLIWRKMVQEYFTALEAKAYGVLNGLTLPAGQVHALTTGATDDDLVNEVEGVVVDLQFIAGGNTIDFTGTHANLYKRLASAVDASGRKLLPQYGPSNASGQARARFTSLDVAGMEFAPAPSLGAASADTGKSYMLDTETVHLWNSAPQRLEFNTRVSHIDLAIWGYVATAVTDRAGVHRLDYDPTI